MKNNTLHSVEPLTRSVTPQKLLTRPAERFCTKRLLIRRPVESDIDTIYRINSSTQVTRWLHWKPQVSLLQYKADFAQYDTKWRSGREFFWVVEERISGQVIGYLASRKSGCTADIGFVLTPKAWGNGYATEAAAGLVGRISRLSDVARIVAICDTRNEASARVLRKAGLRYKGVGNGLLQCPTTSSHYDAFLFEHIVDAQPGTGRLNRLSGKAS